MSFLGKSLSWAQVVDVVAETIFGKTFWELRGYILLQANPAFPCSGLILCHIVFSRDGKTTIVY